MVKSDVTHHTCVLKNGKVLPYCECLGNNWPKKKLTIPSLIPFCLLWAQKSLGFSFWSKQRRETIEVTASLYPYFSTLPSGDSLLVLERSRQHHLSPCHTSFLGFFCHPHHCCPPQVDFPFSCHPPNSAQKHWRRRLQTACRRLGSESASAAPSLQQSRQHWSHTEQLQRQVLFQHWGENAHRKLHVNNYHSTVQTCK